MNSGHKTVVAMLAVVAALLVVNIVQGPRAAEAQEVGGDGEPYVVKLIPVDWKQYHRIWSDGRVDYGKSRGQGTCDYGAGGFHGPVDHPFPVVNATPGLDQGVMLHYEDGRVDLVGGGERCTIEGVGTRSFCQGDTDRNFVVDFDDLLVVLAQWGPCEN